MKRTVCLILLLLSVLCAAAFAEEPVKDLPLDIRTGGQKTDPAAYTEQEYHDSTLDVTIETVHYDNTLIHIAWIRVKSPTQLRTAVAGKPNEVVAAKVYQMAKARNAVVAINGEFYTNRMEDVFIYRQGEMYRNTPDPTKDVLIIDANGDFKVFTSLEKDREIREYQEAGGTIVNAFSFGPVLVENGKAVQGLDSYKMAEGMTRHPRMALA